MSTSDTLQGWIKNYPSALEKVADAMQKSAFDLFGEPDGETRTVTVTIRSRGTLGFDVLAQPETRASVGKGQ
jgi:hypothetical protein